MPRPRTPAEATAAALVPSAVEPASSSIPSYIIQPGQSPKQVEMRRRLAQSLMEQGTSTAPVQGGVVEAFTRPAIAAIAGMGEYGAAEEERKGQRSAADALSQALTGEKIEPQQLANFFGQQYATPGQQSLMASAYENQQKLAQPAWKTFTTPEGDVYRYNENDPTSQPQLFHDQPPDPQKAATLQKTQQDIEKGKIPEIKSIFDKEGREIKVQWDPAINDWKQIGGAKLSEGWSITTNPQTGEVTVTQGGKGGDKTTEAQGKKMEFITRMEGAESNLEKYEDALTSRLEQGLQQLPGGNSLVSTNFQLAQQAGNDWLTAHLRGDSGGVISPQEIVQYGQIYLAQPGDGKEVRAQKKAARLRAQRGRAKGLTPQQILEMEGDAPAAETTGPTQEEIDAEIARRTRAGG